MATIILNAHLHYRQDSKEEDEFAANSIIEDNVEDNEEDVVGNSRAPKE